MSKQIFCDLCPRTFEGRKILSQHKQIHSGVKILDSRSTVAQSVTSHLLRMVILSNTPSFTAGINRTNAPSATILVNGQTT